MTNSNEIKIYDTTLRDGTQREGISLSCDDKLRIAQRLDDLGVHYIEAGWPGSNPKDVEFFERMPELNLQNARITSFGSTCRANSDPDQDNNIKALLQSGTPTCTIVGKSWKLHVTEVLQTNLQENLRMIEQSIAFLKTNNKEVIYDAEHFFDGYFNDPEYAMETIVYAAENGADTIVLCDTNGGTMPWQIGSILEKIRKKLNITLGIHTHNDAGCAVANALIAVQNGATHVQGTINGYGERCGNANLCSIIPDLELKMGISCLPENNINKLYETSHFIAEVANLSPNEHQPYVGHSAFAHKGGIHVSAMRRNPMSYQHIDPELVGNKMRTIVSELSGQGNLHSKAEEFGIKLDEKETVATVLSEIKQLESQGFSFEAAEASVAIRLKRNQPNYQPPFQVLDYSATVQNRQKRGTFSEALVKIRVQDQEFHTAGDGNGPVNALNIALRKALLPSFPKLESIHLSDFKVRILDGRNGTASLTRVLIDMHDEQERWSTVGTSANIIEASWQALIDGIEYGVILR
ncbi:MAG TPA: citramalate synthase [Chloroflexi bacterium]|nr:citramalate synthase [Chloroflexota bacterium]|tara:strand:+ start:445 stop:2010 length:1566 start_codon:yes stop_codon:yes gene_type:complete